jgi:hypothetical protein
MPLFNIEQVSCLFFTALVASTMHPWHPSVVVAVLNPTEKQ